MKSRFYLFALVAICALAVPAFAQERTIGGIVFGGRPGIGIISRVFTDAKLTDAAGNVIGSVKTATVVTETRGTLQGLRVVASGLTPGAEYALVIDGTLVGTATANANGVLRMKFISPTNGRVAAIPDAILPISGAHTVQIFEVTSQRLVASGQFSSDGTK